MISPYDISILAQFDADSWFDKPLFHGKVRPQLMREIEPRSGRPPTVTKEIDYGDEPKVVEVRPATEHWALYFMDGLTVSGGPGGKEAYNRFLEKHLSEFKGAVSIGDMPVNLLRLLSLAVLEATLEYYGEPRTASPHYIH